SRVPACARRLRRRQAALRRRRLDRGLAAHNRRCPAAHGRLEHPRKRPAPGRLGLLGAGIAMTVDTTSESRTDTAATERLSTAPVAPDATGRRRPLLRAWRQLTSMRTALLLLSLLALAAVPGTLLPQRGLNPVKVAQFYS